MADKIQIRRDTSINWALVNPTLQQGELAYEIDTKKIKIGDGISSWTNLSYYTAAMSDIDGGAPGSKYIVEDVIDGGGV